MNSGVKNSNSNSLEALPRNAYPAYQASLSNLGDTSESLATKPPPNTANCGKVGRSEDERQLLGGYGTERDDEAVIITKPTTRLNTENMPQIPSGGPKPINTLRGRQSQPQGAISRVKGVVTSLLTTNIIGDNVKQFSSTVFGSPYYGAERPSKRMKTAHTVPLREIFTHDKGDSDDSDELSGDFVPLQLPRVSHSLTHPAGISTPSEIDSGHGLFKSVSTEHRNVERTMDSSNYAKKVVAQGKRGRPRNHSNVASQMQSRDTTSTSIDLTGGDLPTKTSYRGTARIDAKLRDTAPKESNRNIADNEHVSRYFGNPIPMDDANLEPEFSHFREARLLEQTKSESNNLRDQFTQHNGKQRNSDIGISSDELCADDYAVVSRMSPHKELRRASPLRKLVPERKAVENNITVSEMEPSNIKATTFTNSIPRASIHRTQPKQRAPRGHGSTLSFEAASVLLGQVHLVAGSSKTLYVVFDDDNNKVLQVLYDGSNYFGNLPSQGMQMQSLHKIYYAINSRKVRLEYAQCVDRPSKIDIEFKSEKATTEFIQGLDIRVTNVKTIEKLESQMNKIFEKTKSELSTKSLAYSSVDINDDDDAELRLLNKRKQRRDGASTETANTEHIVKRRRPEGKIVDRLEGVPSRTGDEQISDKVLEKVLHRTDTADAEEPPKPFTNVEEIMNGLYGRNRGAHLTRSKAASKTTSTNTKEPPPFLDDFPEDYRFSRRHGLGVRWKKPLIYPAIGKKKTTVDFSDLERLDDGQFLNDNLIGFYLRYLECNFEVQQPDFAKKVYWFNTYFFASLTQSVKGKRGINYDAVRKWTRDIDIFTYDYAIVPINESAHWYVAVICNLRALERKPDIFSGDGPNSPPFTEPDNEYEPHNKATHDIVLTSQPLRHDDLSGEHGSTEHPDAKDARESFAELHLEEKHAILPERAAGGSEGEILDNSIPGKDSGPNRTKDINAQNTIVEDEPIKPPSSQKRSKRKSIPPMRTFDPEQPAIITLDSLGLPHAPTIRILKDYLSEEAKDKRGGMQLDDAQIKGITAKQIPLQNNYCDCGLFLLGYMDKFVENPKRFVTKILQRQYDETKDWPKLLPSTMRTNIRELVQGLHADQEGARVASKKKSPIRASDSVLAEGQSLRSSPTIYKVLRAALPEEGLQDPSKHINGRHETSSVLNKTEALQTVSRIDEPDSKSLGVVAGAVLDIIPAETAGATTARANPELSPVVLDSQEERIQITALKTDTINESNSSRAQSIALPLEVPATPPRPPTRGKPRADSSASEASVSATIHAEAEEAGIATKRKEQAVIFIGDT